MGFALSNSAAEQRALSLRLEEATVTDSLRWAWETFGASAAVGTSFQGAGLVILHHAMTAGLPLPAFTLDTGLLFPETRELKAKLEAFFGIAIESLTPERTVEQQAQDEGPELWKQAPDVCCYLRKVLPLQKKLESLNVWITGVRRSQAESRQSVGVLELYQFDPLQEKYIYKLNPLAAWSKDQVWDYMTRHGIPYNSLHDKGYRSIGCMPCTRPVGEGDSERAGRWTGFDKTECGIHTFLELAVVNE